MGLIGKLKRKDIDQVKAPFFDYSLSSPATKLRRLDADLTPIIEEDSFPENHERAIVLYNPNPLHHHNTLPRCSSPLSAPFFSLHSDLISGFKYQFLRATDTKSTENEENKKENEGSLAVVPWVPSQIPLVESRDGEQEATIPVPESMEIDEMDVEENCSHKENMQEGHGYQFDAFHQHWVQQQQHCMLPRPPQIPSTPITWSGR